MFSSMSLGDGLDTEESYMLCHDSVATNYTYE